MRRNRAIAAEQRRKFLAAECLPLQQLLRSLIEDCALALEDAHGFLEGLVYERANRIIDLAGRLLVVTALKTGWHRYQSQETLRLVFVGDLPGCFDHTEAGDHAARNVDDFGKVVRLFLPFNQSGPNSGSARTD